MIGMIRLSSPEFKRTYHNGGPGTTIQALHDIWVASNGVFGDCPEDVNAEEEEDPVVVTGTLRIVQ